MRQVPKRAWRLVWPLTARYFVPAYWLFGTRAYYAWVSVNAWVWSMTAVQVQASRDTRAGWLTEPWWLLAGLLAGGWFLVVYWMAVDAVWAAVRDTWGHLPVQSRLQHQLSQQQQQTVLAVATAHWPLWARHLWDAVPMPVRAFMAQLSTPVVTVHDVIAAANDDSDPVSQARNHSYPSSIPYTHAHHR